MVQDCHKVTVASAATSDIPLQHLAPVDPATPAVCGRGSSKSVPLPQTSRASPVLQSGRSDEFLSETAEADTRGRSLATCSWSRPFSLRTTYTVDFAACRDHLAVERTFLGYLRTSTVLAMLGTLVAQLFTINNDEADQKQVLMGKPLAATCYALAIVALLLGAFRSFRHQKFLVQGKALSGGPEIPILGVVILSLLILFLGLTLSTNDVPSVTLVHAGSEHHRANN